MGSRPKTWPWVSREDGWPHPSERRPQIRLSYRWYRPGGELLDGEASEPTSRPRTSGRPRGAGLGRRARPARQLPTGGRSRARVYPVVRAASTEGSDCRWKRGPGLSPRLSVCCATADPGARVAEALRPFREVADEIVVAVDSRLDLLASAPTNRSPTWSSGIEFAPPIERAWSWLTRRCRVTGSSASTATKSPAPSGRRASSPDRGRRRPPVLDSETLRSTPTVAGGSTSGRGGRASSTDSYETTSGFTRRPVPLGRGHTAAGPVRRRNRSTTCSTPARWCATDGRRWRTTRESTRH